MPGPTQGRRALNFVQRFAVHTVLLAAAAIGSIIALGADGSDVIDTAGDTAAVVAGNAIGSATPQPGDSDDARVEDGGGGYVRSPLVPQTPITETPGQIDGTSSGRPDLGDRTSSAVEGLDPLFVQYDIQEGDTLSELAQTFGVSEQTIIDNNIEITDPRALDIGQHLVIPTRDGMLHTVELDQSLEQISELFRADMQDVINFPGNDLRSAADLRDGQVILVVGGIFPEPVEFVPVAGDLGPLVIPDWGKLAGIPPAISQAGFILPYWPCAKPSAIQDFGYARGRLHAGVDMPSFCARSSNVYAAQSGTVTLAAWNGGYGQLIKIDHGYGFSSYYAHLSAMAVTTGQYVFRGQPIGISGNTGASFGEHLHFEIRILGQPTDPKPYLPWPWDY
ncbi:MAG: M23 family metallopeptidase [Dehalococcoidia bacterium]